MKDKYKEKLEKEMKEYYEERNMIFLCNIIVIGLIIAGLYWFNSSLIDCKKCASAYVNTPHVNYCAKCGEKIK